MGARLTPDLIDRMYTKEQIKRAIGQCQFNATWTKETLCDVVLAKLVSMEQENTPYVQPLSVEIIDWRYETDETSNSVTIRKDLRLSIEIAAAFVGNSNDNTENLKRLKIGWDAITRGVLDGEYEIRTTNTNINPNCYLVPLSIQRAINSDKILLEVVMYGDISDYVLYSAPRLDLIRLSILDGRLVVKARNQ